MLGTSQLSFASPQQASGRSSPHTLDEALLLKVQELKKCEAEIIGLLQELDQKNGFQKLGYASLFEYCVKRLQLTESQASAFITVARRSREVPELQSAVQSGELSVNKAKRIASVLNYSPRTEHASWVEKAKTLSQKELEREVFRAMPPIDLPLDPELRRAAENRLPEKRGRMTLSVTYSFLEKLNEAKDLLEVSNYESALEAILGDWLDKNDPVRRAERAQQKRERAISKKEKGEAHTTEPLRPEPVDHQSNSHFSRNVGAPKHARKLQEQSQRRPQPHPQQPPPPPRRQAIPASLQHQIALRNRGRCLYRTPDGKLCGSRRYLHIHHVIPIVSGGGNVPENLLTLCSSHHRLVHALGDGLVASQLFRSQNDGRPINSRANRMVSLHPNFSARHQSIRI